MKLRIGTKSRNHCRCVVPLVLAPSATKALGLAPKKPRANAAAARIAPNRFAPARVPTIDLSRTWGGILRTLLQGACGIVLHRFGHSVLPRRDAPFDLSNQLGNLQEIEKRFRNLRARIFT